MRASIKNEGSIYEILLNGKQTFILYLAISERFSTSETLPIPEPAHELLKLPSALFHS